MNGADREMLGLGSYLGEPSRFGALGPAHLADVVSRYPIDPALAETIRLHSLVLPFRVNNYVLEELIDWSNIPGDPMFQLVFPQLGMLDDEDVKALATVAPPGTRTGPAVNEVVQRIRSELNPHPSGQQTLNVPHDEAGSSLRGVQHKYTHTVLYFPSNGQTCHAYCSYCFRWAQFVGDADLRFATSGPQELVGYLAERPGVTDVLVTGGDPMVMSTSQLRRHIEPLLQVESINTIRFGTKAIAYWPQRFVSDSDADDLLRLLSEIVATGRTAAVMAHFSHPVELEPPIARTAVRRILDTGAVIYTQAPLMRHVNAEPETWARMWNDQLRLRMVPYYQFVARDTGAQDYFKVPLVEGARIFADAYRQLPGLARTVRGPVMSATAGKVVIDGPVTLDGDRAISLRILQARDPQLVGRTFWAEYDEDAAWLDELEPYRSTPQELVEAVWRT